MQAKKVNRNDLPFIWHDRKKSVIDEVNRAIRIKRRAQIRYMTLVGAFSVVSTVAIVYLSMGGL